MTLSQAKQHYCTFLKNKGQTLGQHYKNFSAEKDSIYWYYRFKAQSEGSTDLTVVTSNSHIFTLGYTINDNGINTYILVTPSRIYKYMLNDDKSGIICKIK